MKIVFILILIWSILSIIKVNKDCTKRNIAFNPFESAVWAYLGVVLGTTIVIIVIVSCSIINI